MVRADLQQRVYVPALNSQDFLSRLEYAAVCVKWCAGININARERFSYQESERFAGAWAQIDEALSCFVDAST